jgi:hypothetical protein
VKKHPIRLALPKPSLGDVVFRENLSGQYEEATVAAILSTRKDGPNWTATLLTRNGVEFLGSDVELKSKHEWMPLGWTLERDTWLEPETGGVSLHGKVADLTAQVNELTKLVSALSSKTVVNTIASVTEGAVDPFETATEDGTTVVTLPSPEKGEKFMTWRSRAVKSSPFLKGHENSQDILRDAWHNKSFENIEVTL